MGPDLAEPDPGRLPGGGADAHLGNRAVARVILDIDRGNVAIVAIDLGHRSEIYG